MTDAGLPLRRTTGAAVAALACLILAAVGWGLAVQPLRALQAFRTAPDRLQWIAAAPDNLPRRADAGETARTGETSGPGQIALRFARAAGTPGRLAVWMPAAPVRASLFLNGVKVRPPEAETGPRWLSRPGAAPRLWTLPSAWLHDGDNRLDLVVETSARRATPIFLGPAAELSLAQSRLEGELALARNWLPRLAMLAGLAALALALVRRRAHWLGLAGAATATGAWVILGGALAPEAPAWGLCLAGAALAALALASLASALPWSGPAPWLERPSWLAVAGLSSAILAAGLAGAVGWSIGGALLWPEAVVTLGLGLLLAALALAALWGLAAEAGQRLRAGLDLRRVIARQQAQIEETRRALDQEMRRAAILEERQRLARDMHDGIGGQLASLLARVRTGRISLKQMEAELTGGLSDLRLLVDSLDAVGDSLPEALASFRSRARAQTEGAGMTLAWRETGDLDLPASDPRWLLNLYRLLQEAVTNAVRHSGGDVLTIEVERLAGSGVRLSVSDNGTGFDPARVAPGRGLGNMRHRAGQMEASLSIEPLRPGTRVEIVVAAPAAPWSPAQSSGEITPS